MWISRKEYEAHKTRRKDILIMAQMYMDCFQDNYKLRQTCQCRECKHYGIDEMCNNNQSNNYMDIMNKYASCKHCERKSL